MGVPREIDVEDYILEVESTIVKPTEENEPLRNENKSLKKKFLLYESLRKPPLRQIIRTKFTNSPGRRGAPMEHKGATMVRREQREIINAAMQRSPNCRSEVKSIQRDCPGTCGMDIYLLNYIIMLKFNLHGPIRRVQELLKINTVL